MLLLLVHCLSDFFLVIQDGLLINTAEHAHFLISGQFKFQLCQATFHEDAHDMCHIRWIDVLPDIHFTPGRVSVLGCVLVIDITDDKPKVKGEVYCARCEFCDSF